MPLGFERLNERRQRPNGLINFIKPLETADRATAEDFLQRIAAQCYPVMKKHHISVMSLEEYAPNPEFLGRNFNAGEVIQLVLKDKRGRWLSLKFVQMVMMHELAHCKQMNHSRFFWNVRNEYAKQMEELWRDGYQGEGIWGRGRGLNGRFVHDKPLDTSEIPEHLCGGSYRRRGRKRKRGQWRDETKKESLSYAERQQRRIARKFGVHGDGAAVGEDELLRGALETMNGAKRGQGKPKVANSKRGRELRANAALARLEVARYQASNPQIKIEEDSETDSEWEQDGSGTIIKDELGHDMIKVCGDEGEEDEEGAGQEMNELRTIGVVKHDKVSTSHARDKVKQMEEHEDSKVQIDGHEDSETGSEPEEQQAQCGRLNEDSPQEHNVKQESSCHESEGTEQGIFAQTPNVKDNTGSTPSGTSKQSTCQICSLENGPNTPTCAACSHVLHPRLMPNNWRCGSQACEDSQYINAGDVGRCGLCGAVKPKSTVAMNQTMGRPMGVTSPAVLRWD